MIRLSLFFIPLLILFFSCVTTDSSEEATASYPDWFYHPPKEQDYFFGIGGSKDLDEAKQKSMVNIGQQFCSHVSSTLEEQSVMTSDGKDSTVVETINRQLSDQVIYGAKFVDQYQDEQDNYWVLTRAPLDCMLDVTEGVLMNYRLEIQQEHEMLVKLVDRVEKTVEEEEEYFYQRPDGRSAVNAIPLDYRTISMKKDSIDSDWEGLEPIYTLPDAFEILGQSGYHYSELYICRDEDNLYFRYYFPETNPLDAPISMTGSENVLVFLFNLFLPDEQYKYSLGIRYTKSDHALSSDRGKSKTDGSDFSSLGPFRYVVDEHNIQGRISLRSLSDLDTEIPVPIHFGHLVFNKDWSIPENVGGDQYYIQF